MRWRQSFGAIRVGARQQHGPSDVQDSVQRSRSKALKIEADSARLDDAARAGWLYYVAGNTQD